jgi:3-dehydroquinate dehydratase type I
MLDLGQGPLLVAVADRPAAIVNAAELPPSQRAFDLVEARVDLFAQQSLQGCTMDCARLEATGTPVILTLRSAAQGGRFSGPDAARLSTFTSAIAGGHTSWVDIENDATIVDAVAAAMAARPGTQLIVSHHDFARTPPLETLLGIIDRCHAIAGAVAKIATAIQSEADRDTLLELLARRPDRTCVIGMGASADIRIELAARGSLLAYGYLEQATAPGQMSAAETHARLEAASPRYAARRRARAARADG